ncbi:MAG: hypothetical protein MK101_06175 [Phycisphaerales bacterium]|nr:hypothetical protein [Phycisphaerales bacterium]
MKLATHACLTLALTTVASTIAAGEALPPSWSASQSALEAIPTYEVAGPDYAALWEEDNQRASMGQPWRFAVPTKAAITAATSGAWNLTPEGRLLWQVRIVARDAMHLNFGFEHWALPPSARVWLSSARGDHVRGPWDQSTNDTHGEFWTPFVWGDDVIIEIEVDIAERHLIEQDVQLTWINVGYRGFDPPDLPDQRGSSESCNVDVMCPLGDNWWDEIPSVGVYSLSGYWTCTGALINNTLQDERMLFLTADHCGINTGNDQTMVVYWNHQNSTCRTGSASGNNGNGHYNDYSSGVTWKVDASSTDCCLVEINSDPNDSWELTWSGWNRSSSTPSEGVSIHHPATAEKRISSVEDIYSYNAWGYNFWRVNWDQGRTAGGSSGSPLFDGNNRIIGQLYGGWSYCTNDDDDVYGRSLSVSWNSLKPYLDPNNSNATTLDSWNPTANEGACCLVGGQCIVGPESACDTVGGTYNGNGSDCSDVDCDEPDETGACCVGTTCIDNLTSTVCYSGGGDYQGDGSNCSSTDCGDDPPGDIVIKSVISAQDAVDGVTNDWTVDLYAVVDDGWRIDAVAGTESQPKTISCSTSFYQHQFGGPTSMDINPNLYGAFPNLPHDSRVTIGALDASGDPFPANELQNINIDWTTFENGGDLSVTNGTWFILPSEDQGEAREFVSGDCDTQHGVLIARLTAIGHNATVTFDGLLQGRDASNEPWQQVASSTITWSQTNDCNANGVPDSCDIANGTSEDANGDGVPDECNTCPGDLDGSGTVDVDDILACIAGFGTDYTVDDILTVLANFGNDC